MCTVKEIEKFLYSLAPGELAQSWDNIGLLVGDTTAQVTDVLVALDITQTVVQEAIDRNCQLIVAHHPVMNCAWHPVQTLRDDDAQGRLLLSLLRNNVAAICMHTNLDAAQGGVNDALAAALGLEDIRPAEENGIERIGVLPQQISLAEFLLKTKAALQPNGIRFADGGQPVQKVAVGGGACGEFFAQAKALGCDTFVTADVKYNQFLDAADLGLNLIDAGHYPTEDVICPVLADKIKTQFPALHVVKSTSHCEVIQYFV